jgi:DNA-binding response OmpR family regulator
VPSDDVEVFKHASGITEIESIVDYSSERELVLMVRAALQHSQSKSESKPLYIYGDLEVNVATCRAKLAGRDLKFTPMQFQVLSVLVSHPGSTIDRNKLLKMALGDSIRLVGRNVDVHISAIRMKLGCAAEMVETIRGIGYRFNPNA